MLIANTAFMGPVTCVRSNERKPAVHPIDHQRQPDQRSWWYAAEGAPVLSHRDRTSTFQVDTGPPAPQGADSNLKQQKHGRAQVG
jgi:hypothetical protein